MAIKNLPEADRPRERAKRLGVSRLSDAELLAIVIGSGNREYSALGLAAKLLEQSGGLYNLARLDPVTWSLKGLGLARKLTIASVFELGRRVKGPSGTGGSVPTSNQLFLSYSQRFFGLFRERFLLVLLDSHYQPVVDNFVDSDQRGRLQLSFSRVIKMAASVGAPYAVVMHNHPSGRARPSRADDRATASIIEALRLIDVALIDHLIVAEENYYSYRDQGRLDNLSELENST